MDIHWLQIIQSLGVALATLLGGIATWRTARTQSEDSEGKRVEALLDRQDRRIEKLERENEESKMRERLRDDYIADLRRHINDGSPPPPPHWPPALLAEFDRRDRNT